MPRRDFFHPLLITTGSIGGSLWPPRLRTCELQSEMNHSVSVRTEAELILPVDVVRVVQQPLFDGVVMRRSTVGVHSVAARGVGTRV